MKKVIAFIFLPAVIVTVVLAQFNRAEPVAAVVPVDPERDLYESIRSGKPASPKVRQHQGTTVAAMPAEPLVIEAHRAVVQKPRKVFRAAQFVCKLPIGEPETYTVVLNRADEAEDAILRIKKEGCSGITLKTAKSGDLYDAIVKTAKLHDVRINA